MSSRQLIDRIWTGSGSLLFVTCSQAERRWRQRSSAGVNSPFALAFVTRLKVPGREVCRLSDEVRDDVLGATGRRQQPYTHGSVTASRDFFFVS